MQKALFLDRDGVINFDKGYVYKIDDFEFIHGIFKVCRHYMSLGFVTEYRSKVFNEIGKKYKFKRYDIVKDDIEREKNARTAKIAVNIPQEGDWPWVSPMRVVYYLSIGIPCVHIGKGDNTLFYDKVLSWVDIDQAIKSPDLVYKKQVDAYMNLSIDGGSLKSLFGVWSILENL
jgi:hypothetical protein